jgi:hypothetical protein
MILAGGVMFGKCSGSSLVGRRYRELRLEAGRDQEKCLIGLD